MKFDKDLIEIFENDPLNILTKKNLRPVIGQDDLLAQSFQELNTFYEKNNRSPSIEKNIIERKLAIRLEEIKKDPIKIKYLKDFDKYKLLGDTNELLDIDKFVNSDKLNLLDYPDEDIFELKNIPAPNEKPDFVSKRTKCKNFDAYKDLFIEVQKNLKSGDMILKRFKESDIYNNEYFVMNGLLVLLQNKDVSKRSFKGKNIKLDGRTRCIFENATESNMLFRSLQKQLHKNGYTVFKKKKLEVNNITNEDVFKGYIYILRSLSDDPQINSIKSLYKIGQTSLEINERIKNAKNESTFLMADVEVVDFYKVYNIDVKKFEHLIHSIFRSKCLDLKISKNGKMHKPSEWYVIDISLIEFAIQLFLSDDLDKYYFNPKTNDLEPIAK